MKLLERNLRKDNSSMNEWKSYEWLVTKIYHDQMHSIDIDVKYNQRIRGELSDQLRQIDILITENRDNNEFITIIDCKHHNGKIDIKGVEEFLGMCEDVGAKNGILISKEGFTSGAIRRVRHRDDIKLETIDWETAYQKAEEAYIYNTISDLCDCCTNPKDKGKSIPGIILWDLGWGVEIEGILYMFGFGECLKCNVKHLYCDSCGAISHVHENKYVCECCDMDYSAFIEAR
ncbi:MAG TPA: restriction endonuclease [Clostridium sp.]|nr:restriction endonuclease [Clostridium sp.]